MIFLQTERCIIRDHNQKDLMTHHALLSDKKVMYYLQDIATTSLEESQENLTKAINEIDKLHRQFYFLRIEDKKTKAHIGEIGYTVTNRLPIGKLVGMGYFIHASFWGRGFTAEALKEVIRFAFEEDDVFRISCGCIKDNIASEKVMIRCNMMKEADFKSYIWHDGEIKDRVEYRLLKHEWHNETIEQSNRLTEVRCFEFTKL